MPPPVLASPAELRALCRRALRMLEECEEDDFSDSPARVRRSEPRQRAAVEALRFCARACGMLGDARLLAERRTTTRSCKRSPPIRHPASAVRRAPLPRPRPSPGGHLTRLPEQRAATVCLELARAALAAPLEERSEIHGPARQLAATAARARPASADRLPLLEELLGVPATERGFDRVAHDIAQIFSAEGSLPEPLLARAAGRVVSRSGMLR